MSEVEKVKVWKFTCPECGRHKLGQVNLVIVTYPVIRIPDGGDLDYDLANTENGDGEVTAHQCMDCGYELKNNGLDIVDVDKAEDWVRDNCPQDEVK